MSRGMIPEDLFRIQWVSDARLSPDGRLVACTVTRIRRINDLFTPPPAAPSPVPPPEQPAARWSAVWIHVSAWARVAPQGTPEATASGRTVNGRDCKRSQR